MVRHSPVGYACDAFTGKLHSLSGGASNAVEERNQAQDCCGCFGAAHVAVSERSLVEMVPQTAPEGVGGKLARCEWQSGHTRSGGGRDARYTSTLRLEQSKFVTEVFPLGATPVGRQGGRSRKLQVVAELDWAAEMCVLEVPVCAQTHNIADTCLEKPQHMAQHPASLPTFSPCRCRTVYQPHFNRVVDRVAEQAASTLDLSLEDPCIADARRGCSDSAMRCDQS